MVCGEITSPSFMQATCHTCGAPWLEARYDYDSVAKLWPDILQGREKDLWRFRELLPLNPDYRVAMGEGGSPLIHARRLGEVLGHDHIYIKDERQSPTSSFKDRQAAMAVSAMVASGITECVLASTGNAAAAYAAYCAKAGIKLWVFVTSQVPVEKMREAALYGAEVIKVRGTYDQTKVVAAKFSARHKLHMDRGAKAVVGKESMKAIAYETAEQLGWKAPDWYIQAVSGGIGPIGVLKGFTDLVNMGMVDKMPKIGVVQVEGCSPMVQAFKADKEQADPVTPDTAITVLSTGDPGHAYTLLYRAAKANGGAMVSVSDEESFKAMQELARLEGFSVEPATSVAFAGLKKLIKDGTIGPDEIVVVNASGHTMPVEKFILGDQHIVDLDVGSPLAEGWGLTDDGFSAALEHLDEKMTTIVVIDDSPHDSRLIRRLLQAHKSYRVFEANAGAEGIELVRNRQPDLVVLDLTMPEVNGFDVIDAIKSDDLISDTPLVVVSGMTLTIEENKRIKDKVISTWVKGSYSTRDLVNHIVTHLGDAPIATPPSRAGRERSTPLPHRESVPIPTTDNPDAWTILIVEDNPLDIRLLRRTLGGLDSHILEAHNGQQAIQWLETDTPDLIILDLFLPDMDGLDILMYVQDDPRDRNIPVIIMTAKELSTAERKFTYAAADSVWTKSAIDRIALQEHVFAILRR